MYQISEHLYETESTTELASSSALRVRSFLGIAQKIFGIAFLELSLALGFACTCVILSRLVKRTMST